MPNPFFSGRIPKDLDNRIAQHIVDTGESKTQILIKALAAYVKHPVEMEARVASSGVSLEMFTALEERVAGLEQLLQKSELSVVSDDKTNADSQPIYSIDNDLDPWSEPSEPLLKTPDSSLAGITSPPRLQSDAPKLLPGMKAQQEAENHLDNTDNSENNQPPHPRYRLLTSPELRKLTGMTQFQIDNQKRKVNEKHKKLGQLLEKRKLLESPEKITINKPITVNGSLYDLFYAGQNEKGKDLWSLTASDNSNYQLLSWENLKTPE